MKASYLEGIDREKRKEKQTAEQNQKLFQEVVKSNAEMFKNGVNNDALNFCHNIENVNLFINLDEDSIRNLAIDYFRLKLAKQMQEYSERYLTRRTS